jgi:hypothetical protein
MDEHIRFIGHRNKEILLVDFSNSSAREAEKIARSLPDHVTVQPRASVLMLVDFSGASFDKEAIRSMKEAAVFNKPFVKKSAWTGAANFPEELQREIKSFSRREIPVFESRGEALEWLAKD